jgi:hypothetical protein
MKSWYKEKYPPTLIEAIATHSILNTLGYSLVSEVFIGFSTNDVLVQLCADGKEAGLRMGSPELPIDQLVQLWKELLQEWNTGGTITTKEKDEIVANSQARCHLIEITTNLIVAGFPSRVLSSEANTSTTKH